MYPSQVPSMLGAAEVEEAKNVENDMYHTKISVFKNCRNIYYTRYNIMLHQPSHPSYLKYKIYNSIMLILITQNGFACRRRIESSTPQLSSAQASPRHQI